jgi:hypothetical protein
MFSIKGRLWRPFRCAYGTVTSLVKYRIGARLTEKHDKKTKLKFPLDPHRIQQTPNPLVENW